MTTTELRLAATELGALDVLAMVDESGGPEPELARSWPSTRASATAGRRPRRARSSTGRPTGRPTSQRGRGLRGGAVDQRAARRGPAAAARRPRPGRDHERGHGRRRRAGRAGPTASSPPSARRRATLAAALGGGPIPALRTALAATLFAGAVDAMPALTVGDDPDAVAELRTRATAVAAELGRKLDAASSGDGRRGAHQGDPRQRVRRAAAAHGGARERGGRAFSDGPGRFAGDATAPSAWVHRVADVRRSVERLQTRAALRRRRRSPGFHRRRPAPVHGGGTVGRAGRRARRDGGPGAHLDRRPRRGRGGQSAVRSPGCSWTSGSRSCRTPRRSRPSRATSTSRRPSRRRPCSSPSPRPANRGGGSTCSRRSCSRRSTWPGCEPSRPEQLAPNSDLEQVLPALYFGLNLHGDTVSTDFTRAT